MNPGEKWFHTPLAGWAGRVVTDRVRWLSLLEQGLISGANFIALLLLARHLEPREFGVFSFAWLALQFTINIHRSAVVVPFVIYTARSGGLELDGGAWRQLNAAAILIGFSVLAAGGWALPRLGGPAWMGTSIFLAAAFVGPSLGYEFRRRWLIQSDRYGRAVMVGGAYCTIIVVGVLVTSKQGNLFGAVAAFVTANSVGWGLAKVLAPKLPHGTPTSFVVFIRRLFGFIGWSVMGNLAYNGYYHVPPLLLGAIAGPVPVATFQALRSFMQPLATISTAIDNFDKPRAARALAAQGVAGLKIALAGTTGALIGFSGPYLVTMLVAGGKMVEVVYGHRYGDPRSVLAWLAAMHVATIAAYPLETSLLLMGRPQLVFKGRAIAAAAGIGACAVLVPRWGINGTLAGLVLGLSVAGLAALFNIRRVSPWSGMK